MWQFRHAGTKTPRERHSALAPNRRSILLGERTGALSRRAQTFDFLGGAMTRKRTLAKVAAIGGLIATAALLMGLSAASADELADLRANQELLQRRLDQLSQVPPPPPPSGPGGPVLAGSFPRS